MKRLVFIILFTAVVLFGVHQMATVGLDAIDEAAQVREQAKLRADRLLHEIAPQAPTPPTAKAPQLPVPPLPMAQTPAPPATRFPSPATIAVGDGIDTVLARCGAPVQQSRHGEYVWWHYRDGRIVLRDGLVTGWYGTIPALNPDTRTTPR
jgi:hypothetical protein